VGRHDEIEVELFADPFKKLIANDPQSLLDIVFRMFFWMKDGEWHGPFFAQFLHECFIPVRIAAAEPIVHMRSSEREVVFVAESYQEGEESYTIRSTRDGDDDL
jgi:hypothetical protein